MSKPTMPIIEPDKQVRFSSRRRLLEHVLKHVVEGRQERWHKMLDALLLSAARDEVAAGKWTGGAFEQLALSYQAMLAETAEKLAVAGKSHVHMLHCTLDDELEPEEITSQEVLLWDLEGRIRIIVGIPVRNGQEACEPIMRTGYRPHPRMARSAFARRMREKIDEQLRLRDRLLLAAHHDTEVQGETA